MMSTRTIFRQQLPASLFPILQYYTYEHIINLIIFNIDNFILIIITNIYIYI